jgi:hypothetical protein
MCTKRDVPRSQGDTGAKKEGEVVKIPEFPSDDKDGNSNYYNQPNTGKINCEPEYYTPLSEK